ncbi:two-partner secretion domain-containing protein [Leptothoe sp. PORK10 BA2]|uniref:two-partner secretion domain-containing protein n=1 Tax=Leptothoe sp. PORK10 BA2 TaxID=3110254 RepID=UPI002B1F6898|nr:filamentous hemagglutinin N-terminal domain-containing protein [Leptothoe sp. PORK10 BA2]MEA5464074.1 filamentous hemagglutinin N-terminal domain-containing protein [Leptothoe sp. PORK10 BA2]
MLFSRPWYLAGLLGPWLSLLATPLALAQVTPDATLGAEGSLVAPGVVVRGDVADLIEGGAVRGGNLFHSFWEFNIADGQRVYFANPVGIESILSRVTGGNPSAIFGTLGVDGAADLFLLNPNGIIFGENAALDIEGSFYASTAEAISLGIGVYSATTPEQSSLLTVNPSALVSSYLSDASGDIENRGQLAAGENLTLAANNLDLQGQVAAGGDLTLLGNTVQIRDAVDTPFVGFAGDDLLVQGNEGVDIVALSHPDSGLYSYGDMVLRSANPVGGDAHYWSGGSFRVENLDENLGELFSPIDPIIRALGDVGVLSYQGSSLHILAGGSVNIGTAIINAPDPGTLGVDFLQETIQLSDGTIVQIDGGAQPTLDVRAGVAPEAIGVVPPGYISGLDPTSSIFGTPSDIPTSADITVGDVLIAGSNGLVLLTNQYQPNTNLLGGNISVTGEGFIGQGINVGGFPEFGGQGGAVYLDARNDVAITNSFISTTGAGVVGDVVINASGDVRLDRGNRITTVSTNLAEGTEGLGGSIKISAENVELVNGANLQASTFGIGNAGNVLISAQERVTFSGTSSDGQFSSSASAEVGAGARGAGGNIEIYAETVEVLDSATLRASTSGIGDAGNVVIRTGSLVVNNGSRLDTTTFGTGNAGDVDIDARDRVVFDGTSANGQFIISASSNVAPGAAGAGGNVVIRTGSLEVTNGTQITASTFGNGDAGDIVIEARDTVNFDTSSAAISRVEEGAVGAGGDVLIFTGSLTVASGAQIIANTNGQGDAGNVVIQARDTVTFDTSSAVASSVELRAEGDGGNVVISTGSLIAANGAQIIADTRGQGDAGSVVIQARDSVLLENQAAANTRVEEGAEGQGGDMRIETGNLVVRDGAQIVANTRGQGAAGNVVIQARDSVVFDGTSADGQFRSAVLSTVEAGAIGAGGNVEIEANSLTVRNGARLLASTVGDGDAGNVLIQTGDFVSFDNRSGVLSSVESGGQGAGGNVVIRTGALEVTNESGLTANTRGIGDAGDVVVETRDLAVFNNGSVVSSQVEFGGQGLGGNVEIRTGALEVTNGSGLTASTRGRGNSGDVVIEARDRIVFDNRSGVSSAVEIGGEGFGGDVSIDTGTLDITNGGLVNASSDGLGDAGDVTIQARNYINLQGFKENPSIIAAANNGGFTTAQSGDIHLTTPQLLIQDGAAVVSSTLNDQPGGTIILNLGRLEILNGGQVFTGSVGRGTGGTIQVNATEGILISGSDPNFATRSEQVPGINSLFIPQSVLSVRSSGEGAAGNILIGGLGTTPQLNLNDGGRIIAESASVDGGNIVITLNDLLLMRNDSLISTTAGTAQAGGNGGNITITVPFIVAIPAENSDIAADAFEGAGGNVSITARGIFGIEPRSQRTPLSDITASSELGVSGVVTVDTLDTGFIENSLTNLADTITDTTALTAGSCIARTDESLGSFTVTGSGGLPQRPGDSSISAYPTGTVRTGATPTATLQEPDSVYQLPDGRLVLSRQCE